MINDNQMNPLPADSEDPYRPIRISPDDPRIVTPEDVNGWMLWDDDDYDPDGDIYEQFATR